MVVEKVKGKHTSWGMRGQEGLDGKSITNGLWFLLCVWTGSLNKKLRKEEITVKQFMSN